MTATNLGMPGFHPWMDESACVGHDPELFFSTEREDVHKAVRICGECPVIAECRKYAKRHKIGHGVWAGVERNRG